MMGNFTSIGCDFRVVCVKQTKKHIEKPSFLLLLFFSIGHNQYFNTLFVPLSLSMCVTLHFPTCHYILLVLKICVLFFLLMQQQLQINIIRPKTRLKFDVLRVCIL